jgi:RHS repeat-associated protein
MDEMITSGLMKKFRLILLTLLACQGLCSGQSLYDVVISLSDRHRLLSQRLQVAVYLENQNNDPGDADADLPADSPIDWQGVGKIPSESAVEGLSIGGKIKLLNQATQEFDRLKSVFLNSSPSEYETGGTVGALKQHSNGDFDSLPRATPENYNELLRLLAQRVRALRLIQWPVAFRQKTVTYRTLSSEVLVYDEDEPRVEIHDQDGEVVESVTWKPESIDPTNLDVEISAPATSVSSYFGTQLNVYGTYRPYNSVVGEITIPLRYQNILLSASYPEEARVSATAPGGEGMQIEGTVYILRRSHWHQIDIEGASTKFEENQAGYVVEGSGNTGSVSLFGSPPTATVNGAWVTSWDNGIITEQMFVEGGYQYKEAIRLSPYDPGHSDDYNNSYEKNWRVGCAFYPVFKPTFTRGVDAAGMRTKLESSDAILADNTADGALLLHPRPGLLFGIDLGPGLKGAGHGYISGGSMENDWNYDYSAYYGYDVWGWYWYDWYSDDRSWSGSDPMARFDSSYSLQLAGSCSDYHVVYENDRSDRSQSLPADGMGWPYTISGIAIQYYDTDALYRTWDSPRLKQVVSRDLVADIDYNNSHYGGYTVKVYRRPTGSTQPTPGETLSTSGMSLIRTWTFSHPGAGTTAHPTDAEQLEATGSGGEKYEIRANHILPNQGLGYASYYYYGYADWWWWTEGAWSWTLKLSQGTTEKLRKDIEITTTKEGDYAHTSNIALSVSQDGQETSSLSSMTLDPFRSMFPLDWEITSAGKTIIGSATLGAWDDPASGYGRWPASVSIDYDGIQPDASYEWDSNGLIKSVEQGPWSSDFSVSGDTLKAVSKYNNSTIATTWTEILDGGNTIKTYSAPDGGAGSKSDSSVAWSRLEYGTSSMGHPGLPHKLSRSDGSGTTFEWEVSGDGAYTFTLEEGLLSGGSVSRGRRHIHDVNARGFPTSSKSFALLGGTVQTGGGSYGDLTAWGAPEKCDDFATGLESSWAFDSNFLRLSTHTSLFGTASSFSDYDSLGRPGSTSSNGINSGNTYNAFSITSQISGGASGSIAHNRDALGRLTSNNTTWNGVTDNLGLSRSTHSTAVTRSTLLGTYQASIRNEDGTASTATGPTIPFSGTDGSSLSVENGLLKTLTAYSDQTAAFQTTWTDAWGRIRKIQTPKGTTETLHSDPSSTLRRVRVNEPSGRKLITESDPYDSSGSITRSGIDVNGNGTLGSGDRYLESTTTVSGNAVRTTLKLTENSGLREILRTTWTPDGNQTTTTINGNEETITRTPNYNAKTLTSTSTKGWSKTESFNNLGLTTSSNLTGAGIPTATLTPSWNADGSLSAVTFTAGGESHSATFNHNGTLATLTAPGRGNILGGHSISGGVETLTIDGTTTTRKLDGTEETTSGADVSNKTETLTTSGSGFKHSTTPAVGAATEVVLNSSGQPTAKNYAAGPGEAHQHHPGGLLEKTTLARGGFLTYGYSNDGAKDLTSAAWPAVSSGPFTIPAITQGYGYDRAGRMDEIGDASGVRSLIYQNGRLKQSTWTTGPLAGYTLIRALDASGRETGYELKRANTLIHSAIIAPNGVSGEISGISSGAFTATYGRDGARNLNSITRGSVIQNWTRVGGRITAAGSNVSGAPSFAYTEFDAKGRRKKSTTAGADWTYVYTAGRLTSAVHPTLGSFTYQFDAIGRRTENSANTSDLLNRTLGWTNSQNKTLKVAAHPDARVWVNGTEIQNFSGSHSYAITPPGTNGGWVPWHTLAVLEGEGDPGAHPDAKAEQSGAVWIPPVSESFSYDDAGNRESNALWDYGWNAKNELVRCRTKNHNNPTTPQGYDITHAYDAEGRRFSKKVNRYQNGQIVEQKVITYLHAGNDLIYERHQTPGGLTLLERKYVWGPDIAGGSAGGAGGLLLIREVKGNSTIDLYPLYDGTGHVIALTDNTGTLQAEYAYGPFGETIHARGPKATSFPFRYATKYYDEETGLYNFGRRFLDPVTGQFLSREPLGESESINLYSYCHNDPVNNVDRLGLESVPMYQNQIAQAMAQLGWGQYEHGQQSSAIDADLAKWLELFAAAEAAGTKPDGRLMDAVAWLNATAHQTNDALLATTIAGANARADVASAGINRIYRQSSFLEWVSGRDAGSLDPSGDPAYFDDDNPEFQGDEWRRRWIQFNPGGTVARHAANGQYGAASLEFGKEVAIWSTMGIAGEFVGTGRVAFGVTRGGMGGGAIYNVTDDFSKVVSSGRVWGQTEGSVYGMRSANAPRWRTMADTPFRDPGTIIFEGQAAGLFKPHPVEGLYSGLKRALGQQKAGFGDIVFNPASSTVRGNTLIIRNAYLSPHAGQSSSWAAKRLWGRRLGIDLPVTSAAGYYLYQGFTGE